MVLFYRNRYLKNEGRQKTFALNCMKVSATQRGGKEAAEVTFGNKTGSSDKKCFYSYNAPKTK